MYIKAIKYILLVILAITAFGIVMSYIGTAAKVATAPARVISKTLDTNNIIHNYEWFYDVHASYLTRFNQVRQHKGFYKEETDKAEKSRLRMEMAAVQQTCRTLVTKYNANSEKMNTSIFKGWSLPETLNINNCE